MSAISSWIAMISLGIIEEFFSGEKYGDIMAIPCTAHR
jgi:hypothetical protein